MDLLHEHDFWSLQHFRNLQIWSDEDFTASHCGHIIERGSWVFSFVFWRIHDMMPNQSPEPTWLGAAVLRLSVLLRHVTVPTRLSLIR